MSKGWITDRFPTEDDVREESNFCVEATYKNGLMGWSRLDEFSEDYPEGQKILAWRKIRKPYKESKVNKASKVKKPTCEDICDDAGLVYVQNTERQFEYVAFHSSIYQREEDNSFWRVEYHQSYDGVVDELRDGEARISRVIPEEVTETVYHPFCEYRHHDT